MKITGLSRPLAISLIVSCLSLVVSGQNLVQNPSFEYIPNWDSFWVLSLRKPSTRTAVVTRITTDAHEGTTCVELSNTNDGKWTYFYTDIDSAPCVTRKKDLIKQKLVGDLDEDRIAVNLCEVVENMLQSK